MNTIRDFANELSYQVLLKRQSELNGRDPVRPVTAPAEKPARFVRDERLVGLNTGTAHQ